MEYDKIVVGGKKYQLPFPCELDTIDMDNFDMDNRALTMLVKTIFQTLAHQHVFMEIKEPSSVIEIPPSQVRQTILEEHPIETEEETVEEEETPIDPDEVDE